MREKSPETYEEKLAQLQELREQAIHTNPQAEEKQHDRGKLTARERIDKLLDPGSSSFSTRSRAVSLPRSCCLRSASGAECDAASRSSWSWASFSS